MTGIDKIADKISELAGINIFENTRKQEYVDARALLIFIMYNIKDYKLSEIERYLNSKGKKYNHCSVLYAVRNFNNYRKFNKNLTKWLGEITNSDVSILEKKRMIIENIKPLKGESIIELEKIVQEMYTNYTKQIDKELEQVKQQ